jgi:hypothetical protein
MSGEKKGDYFILILDFINIFYLLIKVKNSKISERFEFDVNLHVKKIRFDPKHVQRWRTGQWIDVRIFIDNLQRCR